jgi:hypothetical protein
VPLLRELRKGQVQMHAMICTAGKNTALLIMRKPIGPSRRKLLAEAVDAKGGAKYITGECVFEDKALTFVVKSPAAQLAKRLRQALLDQADVRMKVRVRGEDGVEEDGEDEVEGQGGAQAQAHQAPSGGPASAEQLAYTQRLRKLRERYEQALEARHPESTKLRAVMGFASEKADEKKDYAAAGKALDMLEKLLSASGSPQEPGRPEVARGTVAKRAFLLERWKKIPVDLRMELGTLLKAIRADYPQVDLAALGKGIDGKLRALIDASQARLADAVDADIQAGDPRYGKTAAAIRSVRGDVASHPMVVALRENAFTAGTAFEAAFASALDEVQAALTA